MNDTEPSDEPAEETVGFFDPEENKIVIATGEEDDG